MRCERVDIFVAEQISQMANAFPAIPAKYFPNTIVHGNINIASVTGKILFHFNAVCKYRHAVCIKQTQENLLRGFVESIYDTIACTIKGLSLLIGIKSKFAAAIREIKS